ncbi:TetR/AcrR family transcriptional regulator [Parvibaculum sp.]|uniref:TetR/AcrR family transcriptional regulator n=1 Tax=Parvibaculum sp. TaxID=2024848 RepID=UPI001AFFB6AC|nr:TetR/AcrR family transcriptional regulator [Parvibaculum sp.]MBO6634566.1 TetR/AcrR family transcriptional regulator [Parvibaculum sp.]MBO6679506.1 TetR/AcrR family transcriptional regulator [Parvibaculum sp.]MBO6684911.1 TetR/AcrR family transcriptional regulator [Parvibaculum sp.]MBO6904276.1 TetR/AcrR family transcriptional regulator [Parvibaculum sp.]
MIAVKTARTRLTPEARRAQLLECALAAFAEHGVARATHSHVAERAGVSVPAVHSYFRTRDDLVAAVLGMVEAYLLDVVPNSLGGRKSVAEALKTLAVRFAAAAREDPDMIKVWLDWSTGVRANVWPQYMELLEKLHRIAQRVFSRGKREGVLPASLNVKAAARLYLGGGHTLALMQFADTSESEVEALIALIVTSIMAKAPDTPLPEVARG